MNISISGLPKEDISLFVEIAIKTGDKEIIEFAMKIKE